MRETGAEATVSSCPPFSSTATATAGAPIQPVTSQRGLQERRRGQGKGG